MSFVGWFSFLSQKWWNKKLMTDILLMDWFNLVKLQQKPGETRRNSQKPRKVFSWLSAIFSFAKNSVQGKCKKQWSTTPEFVPFFFPHFGAPTPQDQQQPTTNFKSMKTPALLFRPTKIRQNHQFFRSWLWWSWVFYHRVLTWSYPLAPWVGYFCGEILGGGRQEDLESSEMVVLNG